MATGQAHTRQEVAPLLGVPRHTLGRWVASSAAGGLEAWLATSVPAGKPVARAPAGLASLKPALHGRAGFASYEALRQGGRPTPGVEVTDTTLYGSVRTRFRAQLKGPRPSHTKQS